MIRQSKLSRYALIGVPSSVGARRAGQQNAPAALRAAGLLERLQRAGLDIDDFGDLRRVCYRPDPDQPRQRNLGLVVEVARRVAERVDEVVASGRRPVVLGGDCSLTVGVVAGLLRRRGGLGLVYLDGDLDLNTPETTPSGIFDGMVLAHLVGRGAPELLALGPRPLLAEEDVVLFGYDVDSGSVDPPEIVALESSRMVKFPLARVRADAASSARMALGELSHRTESFLVHFDVDVMNGSAADVPHPRGLGAASTFAALRVLVSAPACAGLVVTELSPDRDPGGSETERLVRGLAEAFGKQGEEGR